MNMLSTRGCSRGVVGLEPDTAKLNVTYLRLLKSGFRTLHRP